MTGNEKISLAALNALPRGDFVRRIGPVFEQSPWIADAAWPQKPFASVEQLHRALGETVHRASEDRQLALIRAHPDLAGHAARRGSLTRESTGEQAAAGLNRLTPDEMALFDRYNTAYQARFGFPFVICARLNKKEAMLKGFEARLQNPRLVEIQTALAEILKIAELRLLDLVAD